MVSKMVVGGILLVSMLVLSSCSNSYVDVSSLPEGAYVSCDQVKEKVCSMVHDPVCAKIKIVGRITDNIEWEEFSNGCRACHASTKERRVMGFEKGRCGLSDEERVPPEKRTEKERPAKAGLIVSEANCPGPSSSIREECSRRMGKLVPRVYENGCPVAYRCVVS